MVLTSTNVYQSMQYLMELSLVETSELLSDFTSNSSPYIIKIIEYYTVGWIVKLKTIQT